MCDFRAALLPSVASLAHGRVPAATVPAGAASSSALGPAVLVAARGCAAATGCAAMAAAVLWRRCRTHRSALATEPTLLGYQTTSLEGADDMFKKGAELEAENRIGEARLAYHKSIMECKYIRARSRIINIDFLQADPQMPERLVQLWRQAAQLYDSFEAEFLRTGHVSERSWTCLQEAAQALTELAKFNLGEWRLFQLYGRLLEVYTVLAREDRFAPLAAQWAIQRAVHQRAIDSFACNEDSPQDDFNQAIAAAMLFYRRCGDAERLQGAMQLANKHPEAATHYENAWQSPRVYHLGFKAMPWWKPRDFDLVRRLEDAWADPDQRACINQELDGLLADGLFERVFSQSALVVPGEKADKSRNGAEWSEFRFYETKNYKFDEAKCAAIPSLSKLVRDQADPDRAHPDIKQTQTVVSILSLAPGARIMPHCGLTNRQLLLHFALRGSEGVEFTVADETRGYGGDGHAIVFDDSFQHSVFHGGTETRYILFAMLKHPDDVRA